MVRSYCFFCFIFLSQLASQEVVVEPIGSLPFNNHSKLEMDEKEHIKKDGYIYLTAKNFNLGMEPLSNEEFSQVLPNKRGSNVHCIINGEHRFAIYSNTRGVLPYLEDLTLFSVPINVKIPKWIRVKLKTGPVVLFCALRSPYNTSIKSRQAQAFRKLTYITRNTKSKSDVEEGIGAPMVLYNEPTGSYDFGKPVLLDFHLINCQLSPGGNHVIIYIDGKRELKAMAWQPFLIRNLAKGKHTISLRLEGVDGDEIDNPFVAQKNEIRVR